MYNGRVGAVGSPKKPDARREAPLPTLSPSTPVVRSVFHSTGQDQQKDDPAAGAEVREEVLEERMKFGHAAIIPEGGFLVTRNPQGNGTDINLISSKTFSLLWASRETLSTDLMSTFKRFNSANKAPQSASFVTTFFQAGSTSSCTSPLPSSQTLKPTSRGSAPFASREAP